MPAADFADNPIVYCLITDRFHNSRPGRPPSYGRLAQPDSFGTFHGGDFAGIRIRLEQGWFGRLGVNALWISAPYEQIHGWVPGANDEFRHEPYHGYWPLDFTVPDASFGSGQEFQAMVEAAHARGIKVILDVVLGHAGYPDLNTFQQLLPGSVRPGWEQATPAGFDDYLDTASAALAGWWSPDWVCANLPGYDPGGDDDLTRLVYNLPKFRTASTQALPLPPFLKNKPGSRAVEQPGRTARGYLVGWLADWVRRHGVDGFRCDSAKHVELPAWQALKEAAAQALSAWQAEHGVAPAPFWMTGEVYGHGIERSAYYDHGFDNLINFHFQHEVRALLAHCTSLAGDSLALFRLDRLYAAYAGQLAGAGHNVLSYLSSHDTELFPRERLVDGGTVLLLAPGGVQIYYGDESARPAGMAPPSDPMQATRSDMNWDTVDAAVLRHWQLLGAFRARHVALARGRHRRLPGATYAFHRHHARSGDQVVVAIGPPGDVTLELADIFADGQVLREACSGERVTVRGGGVTLRMGQVLLLETV